MQVADRNVRFAMETIRMDGVDGGGSGGGGGGAATGDPLATVSSDGGSGSSGSSGGGSAMPAVSTVYVTIPQSSSAITAGGAKGVLEAGEEQELSRKRQILARRPSYRRILNELGGDKGDAGSSDSSQDESTGTVTIGGQQYQTAGLLKVLPAGGLQLSGQGSEGLQTIAMTNAATAGGAIVHYAQGSDPQFIVPVATSDLSGLKIATSTGTSLAQGVVLATTATTGVHGSSDQMAEEASRKREIRLMKNREAARECRAKKKEYIKCLENRVAVLENQNKALIEELKTLKALYCQNS
ncbi:cyclic AMP-dependent transcription factor ATF-1 isoform X9 [Cherax quadricarinatus]|uniref:cyclic AMP-dependent transcription factor ATF-1 isoform X9 n=1 Tax=Cherax quadricarinatus TaxID=27406 RepID=UPI00387E4F64